MGKRFGTVNAKNVVADNLQIGGDNVSQYSGYNYVINGDMRISQRGDFSTLTTTGVGVYNVDRWKSESTPFSHQVQNLSLSSASRPEPNITNSLLYKSIGSTQPGTLGANQPIEKYEMFQGQTVTFSAYVRSLNSNARLILKDSVSTYSSSAITTADGTTWNKLSLTATINSSTTSLECKVVCADSSGNNVSVTNSDTIEFTGAKLELGSVATPFVPRLYAEELALCQRYFQVLEGNTRNLGNCVRTGSTNAQNETIISLEVEMYSAPTDTFENSSFRITYANTNITTFSSITIQDATQYSVRLRLVTASDLGADGYVRINSSTCKIKLQAEL